MNKHYLVAFLDSSSDTSMQLVGTFETEQAATECANDSCAEDAGFYEMYVCRILQTIEGVAK